MEGREIVEVNLHRQQSVEQSQDFVFIADLHLSNFAQNNFQILSRHQHFA